MTYVLMLATFAMLLVQPSELLASALIALRDGRTVLAVTQTGELQRWEKGSDKPSWMSNL